MLVVPIISKADFPCFKTSVKVHRSSFLKCNSPYRHMSNDPTSKFVNGSLHSGIYNENVVGWFMWYILTFNGQRFGIDGNGLQLLVRLRMWSAALKGTD